MHGSQKRSGINDQWLTDYLHCLINFENLNKFLVMHHCKTHDHSMNRLIKTSLRSDSIKLTSQRNRTWSYWKYQKLHSIGILKIININRRNELMVFVSVLAGIYSALHRLMRASHIYWELYDHATVCRQTMQCRTILDVGITISMAARDWLSQDSEACVFYSK